MEEELLLGDRRPLSTSENVSSDQTYIEVLNNDGSHNIAKDDSQRGPKSNESKHEGLLFGVISKEDDPNREVDAEEDLEM